MPDETHPTRGVLLDAALGLAESRGLPAMSVDEVVRAAGVSKGTFYVHFSDRTAFLLALHRRFYEGLFAVLAKETAGMAPGAERLRRVTTIYLDHCLTSRGVRAMLLDLRSDPSIAGQIRENAQRFTAEAARDYAAIEVPSPQAAAQLYVAMVSEAAIIELDRGSADPAVREALTHFAGSTA